MRGVRGGRARAVHRPARIQGGIGVKPDDNRLMPLLDLIELGDRVCWAFEYEALKRWKERHEP